MLVTVTNEQHFNENSTLQKRYLINVTLHKHAKLTLLYVRNWFLWIKSVLDPAWTRAYVLACNYIRVNKVFDQTRHFCSLMWLHFHCWMRILDYRSYLPPQRMEYDREEVGTLIKRLETVSYREIDKIRAIFARDCYKWTTFQWKFYLAKTIPD